MRRRQIRGLQPIVEGVERRELLSAITDITASSHKPLSVNQLAAATQLTAQTATNVPSLVNKSGVPPLIGPGPGNLTAHELAREQFKAYFSGPFYSAPPRFTSQTKFLLYRGIGGSTQFLHGDYQMAIAFVPANPTSQGGPIIGNAYLQDRNINSSGQIGLDLTFDPNSLNAQGLPTKGTFTEDPNIYSGLDFVATTGGNVTITYRGNQATVRFQGLLYNSGITDPLRNMDLQARGGRVTPRS
jgi:hypothetical protein